jgi:hypothetical protein
MFCCEFISRFCFAVRAFASGQSLGSCVWDFTISLTGGCSTTDASTEWNGNMANDSANGPHANGAAAFQVATARASSSATGGALPPFRLLYAAGASANTRRHPRGLDTFAIFPPSQQHQLVRVSYLFLVFYAFHESQLSCPFALSIHKLHFDLNSDLRVSVSLRFQHQPSHSSSSHSNGGGGGGGAATNVLLLHDLSRHPSLAADRALLEIGNMVGALL